MPQALLCAAPWVVSVDSHLQLPKTGALSVLTLHSVSNTHQQMQLEEGGSVSGDREMGKESLFCQGLQCCVKVCVLPGSPLEQKLGQEEQQDNQVEVAELLCRAAW